MSAPFGRRLCEVAGNKASGGYRIFSLLDHEGPLDDLLFGDCFLKLRTGLVGQLLISPFMILS